MLAVPARYIRPSRGLYLFSTVALKESNNCLEEPYAKDGMTNVPDSILSKLGARLYRQTGHPLHWIKQRIEEYFARPRHISTTYKFHCYDDLSPIVSVRDNFDRLCFPPNHPGRSPTDTYYLNSNYLLRTHTTAHDAPLLADKEQFDIHKGKFITIGDVYRRDEIDHVHYPVFHQVDGLCRFGPGEIRSLREKYGSFSDLGRMEFQEAHKDHQEVVRLVVHDMKAEIEGLVRTMFGPDVPLEWVPGEFPFTTPSYELEVIYKGRRIELCGCGILQDSILNESATGKETPSIAWAFGVGIERLAMVLFDIPDIRYFWSKDPRFLSQFSSMDSDSKPVQFVPFSKFPPIVRDLSFWLPSGQTSLDHNSVYEMIRDEAGDLIESVGLQDAFQHPQTKRTSLCYRTTYRSMSRSLTDAEVNLIHTNVVKRMQLAFPDITMR